MTRVFDDAESFARNALDGFCALHPQFVRKVPDGAIRSTATPEGKVALVIGGGSGHYPAFVGYVGPGLADAAVAGDVFASPSTRAISRIGRLADRGGGVIFGFGNYAGDVLNFGAAVERLRAEGIDARALVVTDDVASAAMDDKARRRGVAGDVSVFKIAGAAAELGYPLDEVMRLAEKANERTASIGVAFAGCTLPGASEPLFHVADGKIGVGLGIHGEPGIGEQDAIGASALADLLVDKLLPERPDGWDGRAAVILNGLGGTKYEELFGLWTHVSRRLAAAGMDLLEPVAGELVTSLDMEGCSLTITFLDEELAALWSAPAASAAMHKGAVAPQQPAPPLPDLLDAVPDYPEGSDASREVAAQIVHILKAVEAGLRGGEDTLGRLDAFAGDGDHGRGMVRGIGAAVTAAELAAQRCAGAASVLAAAADAWADRAGGTSGAIWGLILRGLASALSDREAPTRDDWASGAREALERVTRLGGARPGDKTLVDALSPFVDTFVASAAKGHASVEIWQRAAGAATEAAAATAPMVPKLGRARPLAARSVGHPDAGAVSLALCARIVADVLAGDPDAETGRDILDKALE